MQDQAIAEKSISIRSVLATLGEKGINMFSSLHDKSSVVPNKPTVDIDENTESESLPRLLSSSQMASGEQQSSQSSLQSSPSEHKVINQNIKFCYSKFFKPGDMENAKKEDVYLDTVFAGGPAIVRTQFLNAITENKSSLVDGFLKRNYTLARIHLDGAGILGVVGEPIPITPYQFAYLISANETSRIIYKYIGCTRARSEMQALSQLREIQGVGIIKELKASIKKSEEAQNSYVRGRCKR